MTVTMAWYLISISLGFYNYISPYIPYMFPYFKFRLRRYIKHSRHCFTTFPNTSRLVKNTPVRFVLSTLFSALGNVVKHGLSSLIYYIQRCTYLNLKYCEWGLLKKLLFISHVYSLWLAVNNLLNHRLDPIKFETRRSHSSVDSCVPQWHKVFRVVEGKWSGLAYSSSLQQCLEHQKILTVSLKFFSNLTIKY